ncbi:MAG TPA: ABC transporter permease [Kiritimatiellia bacterium]|nr:ABC transporter permease [Kiritimatiellia bacterium]
MNLTKRELKIRYRGSVLGFLWTLLIPLFMAMIYVGFLRLLAGRGVPLAEIIIGVFAWQFTVQCVNSGLHSITGNVNLVKKVAVPRFIMPLASTLANAVNYVLTLLVQFPLVLILLYMNDQTMSAWWPALPMVLVLHFTLNLAMALFMSASNVYFRDTEHLVNVGLTAFFFISPVMYNLTFVERTASAVPWLMDVYLLNPVAVIITGYRSLLMPDVVFPWTASTMTAIAVCPLLMIIAFRAFQRAQRNFADML